MNNIHEVEVMSKNFNIDWQGVTLSQSINGTLYVNPDPMADQVLEIVMETSIPSSNIDTIMNKSLMNLIAFQQEDDASVDPALLACATTVGDEYKYAVRQFNNDTDLWNLAAGSLDDESLLMDYEEVIFKSTYDPYNYMTVPTYDQTAYVATCTMEMIVNEANIEKVIDIFGKIYVTKYGLALVEEGVDPSMLFTSDPFPIMLPMPVYDTTWDNEEEEQLADTRFKIDTTTLLSDGSDVPAFMGFEIDFEVHPEYEMPDILRIRMTVDAPSELLPDGYAVTQWAQFGQNDGTEEYDVI